MAIRKSMSPPLSPDQQRLTNEIAAIAAENLANNRTPEQPYVLASNQELQALADGHTSKLVRSIAHELLHNRLVTEPLKTAEQPVTQFQYTSLKAQVDTVSGKLDDLCDLLGRASAMNPPF